LIGKLTGLDDTKIETHGVQFGEVLLVDSELDMRLLKSTRI